MAQSLYFARDSKLFLEFDGAVWELPVLDGFSFSQATNTSDITLNEMQGPTGISRRGRRLFTDSLAPAEWSFSTYVRPYIGGGEHHAVEEALWSVMAGADTYGTLGSGLGVIATATSGDTAGDRDPGTYILDGDDVTSGTAAGTGAIFEVIVGTDGNADGVNVINGGTGYAGTQTFVFPASLVGDGTGDVTVVVATLDGGSAGAFSRTTNPDANSPYGALVGLPTDTNHSINFGQSNRAVLATCNLYFVMETSTTNPMVYKMENAQINEASIDFEVDGIATINWSGFAKNILDLQSSGDVTVGTGAASGTGAAGSIYLQSDADFAFTLYPTLNTPVAAIDDGVDSTKTFIRNRITQMQVSTTDTTAYGSGEYDLTLTGGNITVSNNITYLVPEELGAVNVPIEGVTGGRTVTGSFTCYLTLDTAGADRGTSVDLFNDMTTPGKGLDKVVNDFQVTFQVGGGVAGTPRLYVTCPKVHIEVPTHSIEDVISVETGFGAYTEDFDKADEFTLTYFGIAP
jgi:hypothetical protein